jgi:hypothetical protein
MRPGTRPRTSDKENQEMPLAPLIRKIWPGNAEPDANSVQHVDTGEQEFTPQFRSVIDQGKPVVPPRPAADPVVPQTLEEAEAALKILQAASKIVRDKMAENPDLPRGEECFSDAKAKIIRNRRAPDVATALQEACEGLPLSILDCGDLWRAHCALEAFDAYREEHGAVQVQGKIVADLKANHLLAEYGEALPKLEKMDLDIAKTLVRLRDLWHARTAAAEKLRRPPHSLPHPQLRGVGDQAARLVKQLNGIKSPEDLI